MATEATETTTIEIKTDLWAALDRRKELGESFDDVIRRIINDATPAGVGDLEGPHPEMEYGDVKPIEEGDDPGKGCAFYDVVAGESCGQTVEYKQPYRYADAEDWDLFYYCEEHMPEDAVEK